MNVFFSDAVNFGFWTFELFKIKLVCFNCNLLHKVGGKRQPLSGGWAFHLNSFLTFSPFSCVQYILILNSFQFLLFSRFYFPFSFWISMWIVMVVITMKLFIRFRIFSWSHYNTKESMNLLNPKQRWWG